MKKKVNRLVWLSLAAVLVGSIFFLGARAFDLGGTRMAPVQSERKTVLIAGVDESGQNTDVLLLLSIEDGKGASVFQIPRDTYVSYDGYQGKINHVYAQKGQDTLLALVEDAFGVKPDGWMCFSLANVAEIVDSLGGVFVDVPQDMEYEDREQGLKISLKKGPQRLSGQEICGLLRYRKGYLLGDLERLDVQKRAMVAVGKRLASVRDMKEIFSVYEKIQGKLLTNLSKKDMISMIRLGLAGKSAGMPYALMTMPGGACRSGGVWYYIPSKRAAEKALSQYFSAKSFDPAGILCGESEEMRNIYEDKNLDFSVYTGEE